MKKRNERGAKRECWKWGNREDKWKEGGNRILKDVAHERSHSVIFAVGQHDIGLPSWTSHCLEVALAPVRPS